MLNWNMLVSFSCEVCAFLQHHYRYASRCPGAPHFEFSFFLTVPVISCRSTSCIYFLAVFSLSAVVLFLNSLALARRTDKALSKLVNRNAAASCEHSMVGVGKFEEPPTRLAPTDDTQLFPHSCAHAHTHTAHTHTHGKKKTRARERESTCFAQLLSAGHGPATWKQTGGRIIALRSGY